jgi:hypothetical protein
VSAAAVALPKKNIGGLIYNYEQADPDEEEGQNPFPDLFDKGSHCGMTDEMIGERTHHGCRHHCGDEADNNKRWLQVGKERRHDADAVAAVGQ